MALSGRLEQVFSSVGVHPHLAGAWKDKSAFVEAIRRVACKPKVVALGEMGLDRHYPQPPMEDQIRVFGWQLELAAELGKERLPVIHTREATGSDSRP